MDIKAAFEPEAVLEAGAQLTPDQRQQVLHHFAWFSDPDLGITEEHQRALMNMIVETFQAGMTFAVNELAERGFGPPEDPEVEVSMPLSEYIDYTRWLREQLHDIQAALNEQEAQ